MDKLEKPSKNFDKLGSQKSVINMDPFESRNRPNICQHSFVSVGTLVCLVSAHLAETKTGEVRVGTSDSSLGYRRRLSPNHVVYGLRRVFFLNGQQLLEFFKSAVYLFRSTEGIPSILFFDAN